MFRTLSAIGLVTGLVFLSGAALAEQGNSSAWGTVGWGPVVPTQSLSNFDRSWNNANQSKYEAYDSADWLRRHGKSIPFPFF